MPINASPQLVTIVEWRDQKRTISTGWYEEFRRYSTGREWKVDVIQSSIAMSFVHHGAIEHACDMTLENAHISAVDEMRLWLQSQNVEHV